MKVALVAGLVKVRFLVVRAPHDAEAHQAPALPESMTPDGYCPVSAYSRPVRSLKVTVVEPLDPPAGVAAAVAGAFVGVAGGGEPAMRARWSL